VSLSSWCSFFVRSRFVRLFGTLRCEPACPADGSHCDFVWSEEGDASINYQFRVTGLGLPQDSASTNPELQDLCALDMF
jgi:hypothetical protein